MTDGGDWLAQRLRDLRRLQERLGELRDHCGDSYWWADHPQLRAMLIALITGLISFLFAWAQLALERRYRLPRTEDI